MVRDWQIRRLICLLGALNKPKAFTTQLFELRSGFSSFINLRKQGFDDASNEKPQHFVLRLCGPDENRTHIKRLGNARSHYVGLPPTSKLPICYTLLLHTFGSFQTINSSNTIQSYISVKLIFQNR